MQQRFVLSSNHGYKQQSWNCQCGRVQRYCSCHVHLVHASRHPCRIVTLRIPTNVVSQQKWAQKAWLDKRTRITPSWKQELNLCNHQTLGPHGNKFLCAICSDEGISNVATHDCKVIPVGNKIKQSNADTFHDSWPGIDTHWINQVATSNKTCLAPPILLDLKDHSQLGPLIFQGWFVFWAWNSKQSKARREATSFLTVSVHSMLPLSVSNSTASLTLWGTMTPYMTWKQWLILPGFFRSLTPPGFPTFEQQVLLGRLEMQ